MADVTIGELPSLNTMEADALIPVEHDGEAKSMSGTVLGNYVYGLVEDDVEIIAEIIAVGPKGEDGVSPTLSSSKTGKTTTVYYTDATHTTPTVLATVQDGQDGTGVGDMLKATYDADNDGIVDDSERLGGELPSYYIAASEKGAANGIPTLTADGLVTPSQMFAKIIAVSSSRNLAATDYGGVLQASGTITLTIPTGLAVGAEIEILNYGTGTVTIAAASGVTLNHASAGSVSCSEQDKSVVLKCMASNTWNAQGAI